MGVKYAKANYNTVLDSYPDAEKLGGNCTNFVSRCLLESGWHQEDNWYMKRKNTNYHEIANVNQLNESWITADPSPWISAKEFKDKYCNTTRNAQYCQGSYILDNYEQIYQLPYYKGDVVQIANNTLGLNILGSGEHSMFITNYGTDIYDGISHRTFCVTYQSQNKLDASLINLAKKYKNDYFIFLRFYKLKEGNQ